MPIEGDKRMAQFAIDSEALTLAEDDRFYYSKPLTIEKKCRRLNIWKAIGYSPKAFKYVFGGEVAEAVYVDRVIRHIARQAYIALQNAGESPREKDIYERALSEYFDLQEGVIEQITRTRLRLKGVPIRRALSERDVQETLKALIEERRNGK